MTKSKRKTVCFELPWPPSVNDYYGQRVVPVRRGGKTFHSSIKYVAEKGKKYKEIVERMIHLKFPRLKPIDYRVGMFIEFHPPRNANFDTDNFLKGLLDSLTDAGVWLDDGLVFDRREVKRPAWSKGEQKGKVVISLWKYEYQVEESKNLFASKGKGETLI